MGTFRKTAASMVAASAVLLTGPPAPATPYRPITTQGPDQGFRAAADIAADIYREERRSILQSYRGATRTAQLGLESAVNNARTVSQRQEAWRQYTAQTAGQQARAHAQMQRAREKFRTTVAAARDQFGISAQVRTSLAG